VHHPLGHSKPLNLFFIATLGFERLFDEPCLAFEALIQIGTTPPQEGVQPEKREYTRQEKNHEELCHVQSPVGLSLDGAGMGLE